LRCSTGIGGDPECDYELENATLRAAAKAMKTAAGGYNVEARRTLGVKWTRQKALIVWGCIASETKNVSNSGAFNNARH